ncbi:uncharacterized protein PV06_07264 [Exophiala oligosperma]|uniref:Uncharacterized protein n=1 Tax=Exophiala oligosperma TaxID=215243 RepID=A0A0D2DH51_9EURO|nr:uncharacterized protein PV06_07264 [Exophiala oligosperma]KIW41740.1 hypothetical protein PV06_07264 [Exophiala oligosperma]
MPPLTSLPLRLSEPSRDSASSYDSTLLPEISAENIALPPSPPNEEDIKIFHSPPIISSPPIDKSPRRSEYFTQNLTPTRNRGTSPQRRMRPLSVGSIPIAPPMQRAHSSPGVDASGRYVTPYGHIRRPSSPLHSGRRTSPLRSTAEDTYPRDPTWSGLNIEPNIPENEELELSGDADLSQPSLMSSFSNTFPRSRRRTNLPLHQSASAPALYARAASPMSGRTSPSPSFVQQKFSNEPYPNYSVSSASSVPSTPTSLRSRSPSISSLETIEDSPDAEEAALLEEEVAKMKGDDAETFESRRKSSMEQRGNNLRSNKERKRWSVCGAERRADFSLAPIEE